MAFPATTTVEKRAAGGRYWHAGRATAFELARAWRKQAEGAATAADAATPFERAFSAIGFAYLREHAPRLMDFMVGFQVVDKSEDGTRSAGLFGFQPPNGKLVYVPVLFVDDELKGHDTFWLADDDKFVPVCEEWVDALLDEDAGSMGRVDDRKSAPFPDINRLANPKMAAAFRQFPSWTLRGLRKVAQAVTARDDAAKAAFRPAAGAMMRLLDGLLQRPRAKAAALAWDRTHPFLAHGLDQWLPQWRDRGLGTPKTAFSGPLPRLPWSLELGPMRAGVEVLTGDWRTADVGLAQRRKLATEGVAVDDRRRAKYELAEPLGLLAAPSAAGRLSVLTGAKGFEKLEVAPLATPSGDQRFGMLTLVASGSGPGRVVPSYAVQARHPGMESSSEHASWRRSLPKWDPAKLGPVAAGAQSDSKDWREAVFVLVHPEAGAYGPFRRSNWSTDPQGDDAVAVETVTFRSEIGGRDARSPTPFSQPCMPFMLRLTPDGRGRQLGTDLLFGPDWRYLEVEVSWDRGDAPKLDPNPVRAWELAQGRRKAAAILADDVLETTTGDNNARQAFPIKPKELDAHLMTRLGLSAKAAAVAAAALRARGRWEADVVLKSAAIPQTMDIPAPVDPRQQTSFRAATMTLPMELGQEQEQALRPAYAAPRTLEDLHAPSGSTDWHARAQQAVQEGRKDVFEASAFMALLQTADPVEVANEGADKLLDAVDDLGRQLMLARWRKDDFSQAYGDAGAVDLEAALATHFRTLGKFERAVRRRNSMRQRDGVDGDDEHFEDYR